MQTNLGILKVELAERQALHETIRSIECEGIRSGIAWVKGNVPKGDVMDSGCGWKTFETGYILQGGQMTLGR